LGKELITAATTNGISNKISAVRITIVSTALAPRVERQNMTANRIATSPIRIFETTGPRSPSIRQPSMKALQMKSS
jgi:hypothetical protein